MDLLTVLQYTMRSSRRKLFSYSAKHTVEEAWGHYVSNEEFIQASMMLGYIPIIIEGSPNVYFNAKIDMTKLPSVQSIMKLKNKLNNEPM